MVQVENPQEPQFRHAWDEHTIVWKPPKMQGYIVLRLGKYSLAEVARGFFLP